MRVLHIIDTLEMGGAEKLLCNTIQELNQYQHLVVTLFPATQTFDLPPGVEHICLGANNKIGLCFKGFRYRKIIRRFNPKVIHAHLYFATILAKAFTPSKVSLIFTQHFEFSKNITKWYYSFADRILSNKRQLCIAVSKAVLKDYLKTTGFHGRTVVIGIYIPDDYFKLERATNNSMPVKPVALGNVKPVKNYEYLLSAFELMQDLPISCDVYGEGDSLNELESKARKENIAVNFKGGVSNSKDVLSRYDLFIMPSLTEGFPLALFEAMAVGLKPLVSNIPVFQELLGDIGTYFDLDKPEDLKRQILHLIQNRAIIDIESESVKKLAFDKASKEQYLAKLKSVYMSEAL